MNKRGKDEKRKLGETVDDGGGKKEAFIPDASVFFIDR